MEELFPYIKCLLVLGRFGSNLSMEIFGMKTIPLESSKFAWYSTLDFVFLKTVWWDLDRFNAFFCITNLMSKMAIRPPPSVNLPYLFRWAQIDSSLLSGRIDLWLSFQFASHPIKKILGSKSNYLLIWQIELAYQAKPRNPRKIEKQWWNGKLNKK